MRLKPNSHVQGSGFPVSGDVVVLSVEALKGSCPTGLPRSLENAQPPRTPLGPYRRLMPRVQGGSWGGERFLMSEATL